MSDPELINIIAVQEVLIWKLRDALNPLADFVQGMAYNPALVPRLMSEEESEYLRELTREARRVLKEEREL